jgi:hypothetical protein
MHDWKEQLQVMGEAVTKSSDSAKPKSASKPKLDGQVLIRIPGRFLFRSHGVFKFDPLLNFFDWSISNKQVTIDFRDCDTANYQAISLINLYCWRLKNQGCRITFELGNSSSGAAAIWRKMGALGVFNVAIDENANFLHNQFKPLIAIRNQSDFKKAIATAEEYTNGFNVQYQSTLRHVISELLYNVLEHGKSFFKYRDKELVTR